MMTKVLWAFLCVVQEIDVPFMFHSCLLSENIEILEIHKLVLNHLTVAHQIIREKQTVIIVSQENF